MNISIRAAVLWNSCNIQIVEGSYTFICNLVNEKNILFVFLKGN